jgi:hypothetical protein
MNMHIDIAFCLTICFVQQAGTEKQSVVVDPMTAAMRGIDNVFTGPQQTMEELYSGVEDGLSRYKYTAVACISLAQQ